MTTNTNTKNLTPRQAQIKVQNLLRGIDNNSVAITKKQEQNDQAVKEIQALLPVAVAVPTVPSPKVKAMNGKAMNGKAAKPAKAKPAKVAKPAKPALKPATDNRPPLRETITSVIVKSGKSTLGAAEIYRGATSTHKYSRQSVYNALEKHFDRKDNGEYAVRANTTPPNSAASQKDEAERFVESVENTQSTAAVV